MLRYLYNEFHKIISTGLVLAIFWYLLYATLQSPTTIFVLGVCMILPVVMATVGYAWWLIDTLHALIEDW